MLRQKKGQAAMEFLMTYGWAILAAVIAIGVLASLGVFSPGMSNTAIVNAPYYIDAANAKASNTANGGVELAIKNNGGVNYQIHSVAISNCGTYTGAPDDINADSTAIITVPCDLANALTEGDTIRGDITIIYQKTGVAVDLTSTGTVVQKVAA